MKCTIRTEVNTRQAVAKQLRSNGLTIESMPQIFGKHDVIVIEATRMQLEEIREYDDVTGVSWEA